MTAGDVELSTMPTEALTSTHRSSSQQTRIASRGSTSSRRVSTAGSGRASQPVESDQVLTEEELDTKPWKYIGYRGYSSYLASETDFQIFRRFKTSSVRVILKLQDKVAELEDELESLDKEHERRECEDVNNGTLRDDDVEGRDELLGKLKLALDEYC